MTCAICDDTGCANWGVNTYPCACPAGAQWRAASNRKALDAYRDGRGEPSLVVHHVCVSGCGTPVSSCGTQCQRCHEETVALSKRQAAKEAHWLYAVLFGLVAAFPLYFILFKLLGWMP